MSLTVVVYCEGSRESGAAGDLPPPAPGDELMEDELGPAHVLARRVLAKARNLPEDAIRFTEPLRDMGQRLKGSQLYSDALHRVLALHDMNQTELVVVFIDRDEEIDRHERVTGAINCSTEVIVGTAVKEFEAWLIADLNAVQSVTGTTINQPPAPREMLPAGQAKTLLGAWGGAGADARISIAKIADLDLVAGECAAFKRFVEDSGRK